jgi:hypothetical protein
MIRKAEDITNTISDLLLRDDSFKEGLAILLRQKHPRGLMVKAAEELSELTTKLLQRANHPTTDDAVRNKVSDEELIEELVDVQQHLIMLQQMFDPIQYIQITLEKTNKMLRSEDFQKYLQMDRNGGKTT